MNMWRLSKRLSVAILLAVTGVLILTSAHETPVRSAPSVQTQPAPFAPDAAIIIDHTCTDLDKIPDYWLEEAKKLAFHYAHTSHGSQIMSGLDAIEQQDAKYDRDVFYAGSTPPTSLDCTEGALCIFDGNPPETYIAPDDYWSTAGGVARTEAVADTELFDYSMWSWCGQQSDNPTSTVQLYLDTMTGFESQYPDMRFILMTGHTDGGGAELARNNAMVKQYALDHNMILFDFADIESYDPDGNYYPNTSDDCAWCSDWCAAHPEDCVTLPSSCAHSHPFNCLRKGQAFWWMMARLAGWAGIVDTEPDLSPSHKTVTPEHANFGERVTYTVVIRNATGPLSHTVFLSDTLSPLLTYVPGSLSSSSGIVTDADAPTLLWSGTLSPTPIITLTYGATVFEPVESFTLQENVIINHATTTIPGYPPITHTAVLSLPQPPAEPDLSASYKTVTPPQATANEQVTYTVVINNATGPLEMTALLNDTLSPLLSYIPGSLSASSGIVTDTEAPDLAWSGSLSPTPRITLTYGAIVNKKVGSLTLLEDTIVNQATIMIPGYAPIIRTATLSTAHTASEPDLSPSYKVVSSEDVDFNEQVTYTIVVQNATGAVDHSALLSDTLPADLIYVPGSLTATSGIITDTEAPTLQWSGTLSPTSIITLTYAAVVTDIAGTGEAQTIINQATMVAPGYPTITRSATVRVNWKSMFLPIVLRNFTA